MHVDVPEQAHRPRASPKGSVPKSRLGRKLGSVSQELRRIPTRAVTSASHRETMGMSRSGMTHLFGCHDNVLPSTECCSEQPCCLAAVG